MMTLSQWEKRFETAVRSGYATNPGERAMVEIHAIYCKATGSNILLNKACSTCMYRLLADVGRIYFKDKEEMEKAPAAPAPKKTTPKKKKK